MDLLTSLPITVAQKYIGQGWSGFQSSALFDSLLRQPVFSGFKFSEASPLRVGSLFTGLEVSLCGLSHLGVPYVLVVAFESNAAIASLLPSLYPGVRVATSLEGLSRMQASVDLLVAGVALFSPH